MKEITEASASVGLLLATAVESRTRTRPGSTFVTTLELSRLFVALIFNYGTLESTFAPGLQSLKNFSGMDLHSLTFTLTNVTEFDAKWSFSHISQAKGNEMSKTRNVAK